MKKLLLLSLLLISIGVNAQTKPDTTQEVGIIKWARPTTSASFTDTTKYLIKGDSTLLLYSNSFSSSATFSNTNTITITAGKTLINIAPIHNKKDYSDGAIITIDPKAKTIRKGKYILIIKQ